jgi:hypothetical protein
LVTPGVTPMPVTIPPALVEQILAGNCVAFVGAGFSAAARLPQWVDLLGELAARPEIPPPLREHVECLSRNPSAHRLDRGAQLLQDVLGRKAFIAALADSLGRPKINDEMKQRLAWLRGIPFRAILTLNFDPVLDGELPSPEAYRKVLRPGPSYWWSHVFRTIEEGAPVLKLHGDLRRSPVETVVITRQDYRRRLYADSAYQSFLRAIFTHYPVLFLGVSFEDAYLDELRSETLALLGYDRGQMPVGWAVMNDCEPATRAFFKDHEGIELLGYDTDGGRDHSGFDRYLEALYDATHPIPYLSRLLADRRILWLDPRPDDDEPGLKFLRRAAARASERPDRFVQVETVEQALAALRSPTGQPCPFQLVVTCWGAKQDPPTAVVLLEHMRAEDLRCPVVVFSTAPQVDALETTALETTALETTARKTTALTLGAAAYCSRWESLFREVQRIFEPGEQTG